MSAGIRLIVSLLVLHACACLLCPICGCCTRVRAEKWLRDSL